MSEERLLPQNEVLVSRRESGPPRFAVRSVLAAFAAFAAGAAAGAPRVVVVEPASPIVAGESCTIEFTFPAPGSPAKSESGESGFFPGDVLEIRFPHCSPYPYLRWTRPQLDPDSAGAVRADGPVSLAVAPSTEIPRCATSSKSALTNANLPLAVHATVTERVAAGESIRVTYGAPGASGAGRARAQRFPEASAPFRFALRRVADGRTIEWDATEAIVVHPTRAAHLHVSGPSDAVLGESFGVRTAALDSLGFPADAFPPAVVWRATHESGAEAHPTLPARETQEPCTRVVSFALRELGVWWVRAQGEGVASGWDLPVVVAAADAPGLRLRFGDLHWHTNVTDGSRSPVEGYRYARDVVGLDFTARLDHDYAGPSACLDEELWEESVRLANEWNDPGRFASFVAYEWTWGLGDRSVYYRGGEGALLSVTKYSTVEALWAALAPGEAITVPHHPVGGRVAPAVDWSHHDPRFQKAVEVYSMHGDAESEETPLAAQPKEGKPQRLVDRHGNVQRALAGGLDLAFLASTDNHVSTPGCPIRIGNRDVPAGPGLCAAWVPELTREAVFDAIAEGRVYGTSGPRIRVELNAERDERGILRKISGSVVGTAPFEEVVLVGVRDEVEGRLPDLVALPAEGRAHRFAWALPDSMIVSASAAPFRSIYLRVVQSDGERAWSSPIPIRRGEPAR